jgi:hypothetical protein
VDAYCKVDITEEQMQAINLDHSRYFKTAPDNKAQYLSIGNGRSRQPMPKTEMFSYLHVVDRGGMQSIIGTVVR